LFSRFVLEGTLMAIPDSVRKVVESGKLAHLVTLHADGSPQVTCVWAGVDDDEIVIASIPENLKVKNVRRDGRVCLSIETDSFAEGGRFDGLREYLIVNGEARITEGGAADLLQELAYRYIGPGVKFPPIDNPPPGYVTRITPTRYGGVGPWAES
jgi:PPOX class probable F420-dependent enzyme